MIDILRDSDLFGTLSDTELEDIAIHCRWETYHAQETIYYQGEISGKLYVIVDGTVALVRHVYTEAGTEPMTLTTDVLARGRGFSWSALVSPHVHGALAICQSDTRLLAIDGATLRLVLEKNFHAGFEVMRNLAALFAIRLRGSYDTLESMQ